MRPLIFLAFLLAPGDTLAQGPDQSASVTIEFRGGTVSQFVETVRDSFGASANIVVETEARNVVLSAVELTVTDALSAAAAVPHLEADAEGVQLDFGRGPEFGVIGVLRHDTGQREPTRTHVWTLIQILDSGYEPSNVLSAVKTSLQATSDVGVDVKYHEDTQLLIANATGREIDAIGKVLNELVHASEYRLHERAAQSDAAELENARERIIALTEENRQLLARLQTLEIAIDELRAGKSN